jgi:hypothetical protein
MAGDTDSSSLSELYGYPVPDTWVDGQTVTADWLNTNIRDSQLFLAYAPLTMVYRSSTQSIPSGSQAKVTFDTEVIDVNNMFSPPSTDIIVQSPGVYEIQFNIYMSGTSSAGSIRASHIGINGNWIGSNNDAPANGTATSLNCASVAALAKGDVINGYVYQDSGVALTVGGGNQAPRLAARLLSTAQLDSSLTTVTVPPSTPPTSTSATWHSTSFGAAWSRSYINTNYPRWDDPAYCYQGVYPGYGGNQKSLVGFNYSAIQSTLAGAANITGTFNFKVAHSYWNAGMTAVIGSHNSASKPATWPAGVDERQMSKGSCVAGHTYSIALKPWHCWAFQNNVIKGMAFGSAPSSSLTYYGFMYGAGQGGAPYLTFTYYK